MLSELKDAAVFTGAISLFALIGTVKILLLLGALVWLLGGGLGLFLVGTVLLLGSFGITVNGTLALVAVFAVSAWLWILTTVWARIMVKKHDLL